MLHEAAPCTCGLLYGSCGGGCSSLLFAAAAAAGDHHHHYYKQHCDGGEAFFSVGGPYGGSVDCTLSLGTPSTRRAEAGAGAGTAAARAHANANANANANAGLHWADAPAAAAPTSCNNGRQQQQQETGGGARRCANCDTTSTPLWRNGPRGPKSLCNACGIRYKKEERRAAAAAVVAPAGMDGGGGVVVDHYAASYGGYARHQTQQWGCYGPVAKAASFGMFGDAATAAAAEVVDGPCGLPWGLGVMPAASPAFGNVREMPSLFQYY